MNCTAQSGGGSCLWKSKQAQFSPESADSSTEPYPNTSDFEIERAKYFLGRAIYRYSLLQNERSTK